MARGHPLGDSPLAHANFVNQQIQSTGVVPTPAAREWVLSAVITEIVQDRLAGLRDLGTGAGPERGAAAFAFTLKPARSTMGLADLLGDVRECLERDFLAENQQREAWSCLYYRFIHVPPLRVQEITAIVRPGLPHGRKVVVRRTALGFRLLTAALLEREAAALSPTAEAVAVAPPAPGPVTGAAPATIPSPIHSPSVWNDAGAALDDLRATILAGTVPLDLPREQARLIAGHAPANLAEYRLTRIAAWCRPRHALDKRFVALSMLVDLGEEAPGGRWVIQERRFDDLAEVLTEVHDPALVLLGAPGSGKSTLLRRLELDLAAEALRAAVAADDPPGAASGASAPLPSSSSWAAISTDRTTNRPIRSPGSRTPGKHAFPACPPWTRCLLPVASSCSSTRSTRSPTSTRPITAAASRSGARP
jgi:hypothetical protein